jgi:hypothetical protein
MKLNVIQTVLCGTVSVVALNLHVISEDAEVAKSEKVLYEQELRAIPVPATVPVFIDGQQCLFYLDTGAGSQLLDTSLRKLVTGPGKKNTSAVGWRAMDLEYFDAPPIRVGSWAVDSGPAAIMDLSSIRQVDGRDIRGLIGFYGLKADSVWFDFDHSRFRRCAGKFLPPVGMQAITLNRSDTGAIAPQFTVNMSDRRVTFTVDSGFNGSIGLDHDTFLYLQDWGFIEPEKTYGIDFGGAGSRESSHARFKSGTLFGMPLRGVNVVDNGLVSIIGLEILVNFNLIFDWKGGKLYYQRRKCLPPINALRALGALIEFRDGKPFMAKLQPGGGPAAAAGIKEGDEIVRMDAIKAKELNVTSIYEMCLKQNRKAIEVEVLHQGDRNTTVVKINVLPDQWVFPPENLKQP